MAEWVDLIDPSEDELRSKLPRRVQESALELLLAPARHDGEPRPTLQAHGDYIFGIFLAAVAVPKEDRVFYQEIDVVLTHETLMTVSKTPPGEQPYDPRPVREACEPDDEAGMMLYRLVDDIAEHYLDLVDTLDGEIDELEDNVETSPPAVTRNRLSELRHDLLHIRHTLAPTRDAVRRVVDNVIEVDKGTEVFPHEVAAGQDRERPERGHEEADDDRLAPAPPDVHRRPLRPELPQPFPGTRVAVGLRVVVGTDRPHDPRAARLLPLEEVDLVATLD